MEDRLLTVPETCQRLAVTKSTLDKIVRSGALAAVRIGDGPKARRRFRVSDVGAYITSLTPAPEAEEGMLS